MNARDSTKGGLTLDGNRHYIGSVTALHDLTRTFFDFAAVFVAAVVVEVVASSVLVDVATSAVPVVGVAARITGLAASAVLVEVAANVVPVVALSASAAVLAARVIAQVAVGVKV